MEWRRRRAAVGTGLLVLALAGGWASQVSLAESTFQTTTAGGTNTLSTAASFGPPTIGTSTKASGSGTSMTVNKPAGVVDGSVLFAAFEYDSSLSLTAASGYSLVRRFSGIGSTAVYSKIITNAAGEPASYTFIGDGDQWLGIIVPVSGANTTTPVDVSTVNNGYGGTLTATGLTTGGPNRLLLAFAGMDWGPGSPYTPPAGMTEIDDRSGGAVSFTAAHVTQASAGASGNKVFTASDTDVWGAILVAVQT
jgi:hypothetical protein